MEVVKKVKVHSSKWIKTKDKSLGNFYWQDGYGAFSVNPKEVNVVIDYIKNQQAHHQAKTFRQEYRALLNQYNVEFDERYVWE